MILQLFTFEIWCLVFLWLEVDDDVDLVLKLFQIFCCHGGVINLVGCHVLVLDDGGRHLEGEEPFGGRLAPLVLPLEDVLEEGAGVCRLGELGGVEAPLGLDVPGAVGVLEADASPTRLDAPGVAPVQGHGLHLVVRQNYQLLLSRLFHSHHLDIGHRDVVGEDLCVKIHKSELGN